MGTGKLNGGRGGEEILLAHLWNHKLELMLTQMNHLACECIPYDWNRLQTIICNIFTLFSFLFWSQLGV